MDKAGLERCFLRSRADQLADYLRGCIARGDLIEPLPNIRAWSLKLGVGRGTLERALQILHQEKVLRVHPRKGVEILRMTHERVPAARGRVVRWLFYGRDFPDLSAVMEMYGPIADRLSVHDIRLNLERCDANRLRAIHQKGESPQEMLWLTSLPRKFQMLFADFRHSALINGLPVSGVALPYISVDVLPALRHATHQLARRGFSRVSLILKEGSRQPIGDEFQRYCGEVQGNVTADIVHMPIALESQATAADRWAGRVSGRQGVIAIYPIPASVLVTALMKRGLSVPGQVEVVALNTTLQAVRVVPLPSYYPYPIDSLAKILCAAAVHYFERGQLPLLRKMIPIEVVRPR